MIDTALTDPAPAAALGETRTRVLDLLRAAGEPLGAQQIAERTGLHPNTARFHLDGLVEAGLAQRGTEERDQPGRPRTVYRAAPADAGRRSYRLLAEILTTLVTEQVPQPERVAAEAGRAWGSYLTERPAPFERTDAGEAVERLLGVLTEIGFGPEAEPLAANTEADPDEQGEREGVADGGSPQSGMRILLHHCPFREVASRHRTVVCPLHLGLMQGVLAELRAPLSAERLDPFVEPHLCIAHLTAAPGAGPRTPPSRRS